MNKKGVIAKIIIAVLLIAVMLPAFSVRLKTENNNKDVVMAINYNSFSKTLSEKELVKSFKDNKKIGVNTILISEESANSLSESGFVTAAKYKDICHKYDNESTEIANLLRNDKIHDNSYVFVTSDEKTKKFFETWIPAKYTSGEYQHVKTSFGADVYAILNDNGTEWQIMLGVNRQKLDMARDNGFDIALSMIVGDYNNTEYIKLVDSIIKEYDIKYLNLKKNLRRMDATTKEAKKNYEGFVKVIKDNNLTLVLTEDETQLSNQKPIGYNKLVKSANGKVIRCYDTSDYLVNKGLPTDYEQRYQKIINSVVDRNIRFVNILQLTNGNAEFSEKDEKTTLATKMAIEKLEEFGFNTKEMNTTLDGYSINRRLVSAAAMLLMILMWLVVIEILSGKDIKWLEILAGLGGALSILFTFIAPEGIVLLYPSLYAVTAPCFSITVVYSFISTKCRKMQLLTATLGTIILTLALLLITGIAQSAMLAGADYYLNSLIFRGIKLSLIAPIVYSFVAYFIIEARKNNQNVFNKMVDLLKADIKVYWVILAGIVGVIGLIYIIRSGNVKEISGAESSMRNTITNMMAARPRTKEFLVGWPCLILFVYYININKTKCEIAQFLLALGSSILFASVINSFCHVFTDATTIYMRVYNGLGLGVLISAALYVVNAILIAIIKYIAKKGRVE